MQCPSKPALTIGFVLVPDFTMLALAAFIDTLRLAGDEGDRSRPINCGWTLMTEDGRAVRASNGVSLEPDGGLVDPGGFDYVAVVGGTMHRGSRLGDRLREYLERAAAEKPLIGICTGSFVLARAGLMNGRRSCVSWFHRADFEGEFPELAVASDQLFMIDRDRVTCAGGTGVIHLAGHLVERHLGPGRSTKGLRIMLEDRARAASAPQPPPFAPVLDRIADPRVRRAALLMERRLQDPEPLDRIARAVGLCTRQLGRLFVAETGRSPAKFREELRLDEACSMIKHSGLPLTEIGLRCGFADASHFSRRFHRRYGYAPIHLRDGSKTNNG